MPLDPTKEGYRKYQLFPEWEADSGQRQMSVQGPPGTPCAIVQVSAPLGRKVVYFHAVRDGKWPEIPAPEVSSTNEVFLHFKLRGQTPVPIEGGIFRFSLSGVYTYALRVPNMPADGFPTGMMPCVTESPSLAFLGAENFSPNIIEPSRVIPPPEGEPGIQG